MKELVKWGKATPGEDIKRRISRETKLKNKVA